MPFSSFLLVLAFLALHSVAARWIYSEVPYDAWSRAVLGESVNELLGWQRNNFDRLVHVAYGVCAAGVLMQSPSLRASRRAALRTVEIVLSTSALYELFEWGIAQTLAPGMAEAYNGQQGDIWDPHKDMTCAVAGAVVTTLLIVLIRRWRARPERPPQMKGAGAIP